MTQTAIVIGIGVVAEQLARQIFASASWQQLFPAPAAAAAWSELAQDLAACI